MGLDQFVSLWAVCRGFQLSALSFQLWLGESEPMGTVSTVGHHLLLESCPLVAVLPAEADSWKLIAGSQCESPTGLDHK